MNSNTIKPKLALRAHSIRNLTAAELRAVNGGRGRYSGCGGSCEDTGKQTCDAGTSVKPR